MKKILLIIILTLAIFQMVVLATAIDVGMPATERSTFFPDGEYTIVNIENPANATGEITTIEIWSSTTLYNCEVATFYVVSGNNLSTRDYEVIGTVTKGSKQSFPVTITVEEGDYLGLHYTSGNVRRDTSGYSGVWYAIGDHITCSDFTFSLLSGNAISLYGIGATAVGWAHKWNTVTISKWNTKEFTKWNDLE